MKYRISVFIAIVSLASCGGSTSVAKRLITAQCVGKDAPEVLVRNSIATLSVNSSVEFTGSVSVVNGQIEFLDTKDDLSVHISFPDINGAGVLVAEITTTSGESRMKTFDCKISNGKN